MAKAQSALVWLRRDFRTEDHTALFQATAHADQVEVAFVLDPEALEPFAPGLKPHASFFGALLELRTHLQKRGADIHLLTGSPIDVIPALAKKIKATQVHAARDYEPLSRRRDQRVADALRTLGAELYLHKDTVLFEEAEILTGDRTPYRVFTPYRNAAFALAAKEGIAPASAIQWKHLHHWASSPPAQAKKWEDLEVRVRTGIEQSGGAIEPGEKAAHARLDQFLKTALNQYPEGRNLPAVPGTSRISQDLRNGALSPRQVWLAIQGTRASVEAKRIFQSELVWRDFFHMIGFHYPHVFEGNYNSKYNSLRWRNDRKEFTAWCEGRTGFPIVDAGMRELVQTGFMHNRVRMITAMFLTKDLLVDWRWGEAFFRQHLVDGDLAVNNGNWQWCASTGVDAQPYFRIFNPTTQGEKFDPEQKYIRRFIPELDLLGQYPEPMVDHKQARQRCLDAYKAARSE